MSKMGTVAFWVGNKNGLLWMHVSLAHRFPLWKCYPDSRMASSGPCPNTVNSHMVKILRSLKKPYTAPM